MEKLEKNNSYTPKLIHQNTTYFGDDKQNKPFQSFRSKNITFNNTTLTNRDSLEKDNKNEYEKLENKFLDINLLRSLIKIIKRNYEEEKQLEEKHNKIQLIIEKVWRVVRIIKLAKIEGKEFNLTEKTINEQSCLSKCYSKLVMHPELSKFRFFIDVIMCILLSVDLILSPFEYLIENPKFDNKMREIIFDSLFLLEIISNFFTAYFKDKILKKDFKSIAKHYLRFKLIPDILSIAPFWLINKYLIYLRFIKIYKYPNLISKVKMVIFHTFSLFIKSLKLIHSIKTILTFLFNLFYILHFSACVWILIGRNGPEDNNWLVHANLTDATKWEKYETSLYFLLVTFITIGYGDILPQTIPEILYVMFCEIINVGLYAYFISCIMEVLANSRFDEISFKYNKDVDIDLWMMNINKNISAKMKIDLFKEKEPIFNSVKKYFILFHKMDHTWIKDKFDFLKQMRPREKNMILQQTFSNFFKTFKSFFIGLDTNFKNHIALNIKTKFMERNDKNKKLKILINECNSCKNLDDNCNNKIKYFYFILKGKIGVFKNNQEVCRLLPGSYFGDEILINKHPTFTYKCLDSNVYLFYIPVKIIEEFCSFYEESYLMLLFKSLIRLNKMKTLFSKIKIVKKKDKRHLSISNLKFSILECNLDKSKNVKSLYDLGDNLLEDEPSSINDINNDSFFQNSVDLENEEIINPIDDIDILNKLFDDPDFIDKIEINDENLGSMKIITKNKERYQKYFKNTEAIEKKILFLKNQLDLIKLNFGEIIEKAKYSVETVKQNKNEFIKKSSKIG